jgi:hypothetical protein
MQYRGSCHCGRVAYEVEGEISEAFSCNCSLCSRRGGLLWFAPREKFTLLIGRVVPDYLHVQQALHPHQFCQHCGIQSFALGKDPRGKPDGRDQPALAGELRPRKSLGQAHRRQGVLRSAWSAGSTCCGGIAGFIGVALGAFAAHGLKVAARAAVAGRLRNRCALPDVSRVRAVRGRVGHARWPGRSFSIAGWLFVAGIVLFSG